MKMKKVIAIILAGVGILSAGAAETRADSFVIEQGFFETRGFSQIGTFSGEDVLVSDISTPGGNFRGQVFDTAQRPSHRGTLVAGFGRFPGADGSTLPGSGTIEVGDVNCELIPPAAPAGPACGGTLTFINSPITIGPPNLPGGSFAGEAPFTMTGQLVLANLTVDIEGSGIVHAFQCTTITGQPGPCQFGSNARYEFAAASVPEPSTVVLLLSGLVAVGGRRWRGGKRPVSRCRGLADSDRHGDRTR
jgi:PEP-CTERM motif